MTRVFQQTASVARLSPEVMMMAGICIALCQCNVSGEPLKNPRPTNCFLSKSGARLAVQSLWEITMIQKISTYMGSLVLLLAVPAFGALAELKKTPYPAVRVEISQAYEPDTAFEKMRKSFLEAAKKMNANALFALVAPGFVWTVNGALSNDFDTAREPLHNFKVLFGFRKFGEQVDGGVEGGPYWDALSAFAEDESYSKADQASEFVCGPISAVPQNVDALEAARKKIDTADEAAAWYFAVSEVRVTKTPGDTGAPIDSLKAQAVPVLSIFPAIKEGQTAPPATHYEVLLPSGKAGWIPAAAVRPLNTSRLCYALTVKGDWVISLYDSVDEEK
jgi:hypothetical protein